MAANSEVVSYVVEGRFAIITLNNPKGLNSLTFAQFYHLASLMEEIDKLDNVLVTVLAGKGRFFSAGANVGNTGPPTDPDQGRHWLNVLVANNLYLTQAFSRHSKILVFALNGPAVGGAAAISAFADFVYATPHTFLLLPFASLGMATEVGTSYTLVQRLGISLANEALLMGRKIAAADLVKCGFVYRIVDVKPGEDVKFRDEVMADLSERFGGDNLNGESLLKIKALIRRPSHEPLAAQTVAEVFEGWPIVASGTVAEAMRKLTSGQMRHKL